MNDPHTKSQTVSLHTDPQLEEAMNSLHETQMRTQRKASGILFRLAAKPLKTAR